MADAERKLDHTFYFANSKLSLEKSIADDQVSNVEFDENELTFTVTLDRIAFDSLPDVLSKTLTSNSFAINIENLLACLDSFQFGVNMVSFAGESRYFPAIRFVLPRRNQQKGIILGEFYKEIEKYEQALLQSQLNNLDTDKPDELERKNLELQARIAIAEQELVRLRSLVKSWQGQFQAISSSQSVGEEMPQNIRRGVVKDIDLTSRLVKISTGRKLVNLSMQQLSAVPQKGTPVLVRIDDGNAVNLMPLTDNVENLQIKFGNVLAVKSDSIKIRSHERKVEILVAQNNFEEDLIRSMRRGDAVALYYLGEILIKFVPLTPSRDLDVATPAQDKMMRDYLVGQAYKGAGKK